MTPITCFKSENGKTFQTEADCLLEEFRFRREELVVAAKFVHATREEYLTQSIAKLHYLVEALLHKGLEMLRGASLPEHRHLIKDWPRFGYGQVVRLNGKVNEYHVSAIRSLDGEYWYQLQEMPGFLTHEDKLTAVRDEVAEVLKDEPAEASNVVELRRAA